VTTHAVNRRGDLALPSAYVEAVRRAGGAPVLLPAGGDEAAVLVTRLDGLVLTGGGDVDPSEFDQQAHSTVYGTSPDRDRSDLALVHAVLSDDLPLLAICRGMQVVNVAMGGTLHQHVPDVFDTLVAHRDDPTGPILHDITVDAASHLSAVMGVDEVRTMSWHHQAVDSLGKGLTPVATAPDGLVEALALDGSPRCLIVQWHPELTAGVDPTQQALFDEVVASARERARS
jgi:putative glutamine amidotransferase